MRKDGKVGSKRHDLQILIGMMVIRGIYERHQVHSLNHGIGFDTATIEFLLPTYGESLGLRGKICERWAPSSDALAKN
jgi:malonate decarboxylase alpha subunit